MKTTCLTHIFVSLTLLCSCFRVLYISDEQERNKTKTHTDAIQLRRISHPASHPYKEGPHVRGNGTSTQNALDDKDKIQRINHPAEDQAEGLPGNQGFGRTWPGSRPGALRGGVTPKAPDHLPYVDWRETDLQVV